jgi:hypothetical protein
VIACLSGNPEYQSTCRVTNCYSQKSSRPWSQIRRCSPGLSWLLPTTNTGDSSTTSPRRQLSRPLHQEQTGFDYSVYGVRVPALFINPFVRKGIFRTPTGATPFDHTSLLATLKAQFNLSGSLSPRVDVAPTLVGLINPTQPAIKPPSIPIPACNWDSSSLRRGHADPMIRTALWNAAKRKVRET